MTVVEKTVTTVTVTEMGMKSTQRLYCKQKGSIHPFVEVYRPLEQPRSTYQVDTLNGNIAPNLL